MNYPMTAENFMRLYQDIEEFNNEFNKSKSNCFMGVPLNANERSILGVLQSLIITNLTDLNRLESQISSFTFSIYLHGILYCSYDDLPLLINDPDPRVRSLVKWRLTRQTH